MCMLTKNSMRQLSNDCARFTQLLWYTNKMYLATQKLHPSFKLQTQFNVKIVNSLHL